MNFKIRGAYIITPQDDRTKVEKKTIFIKDGKIFIRSENFKVVLL